MGRWGKRTAWAAAAVAVVAGALGIVFLLRYPKVPDPRKISAREAIRFMANGDFNRMRARHQSSFVNAVIDKQRREMSFEQLVALMIDPTQEQVRDQMARNVKRMTDAPVPTSYRDRLLPIAVSPRHPIINRPD